MQRFYRLVLGGHCRICVKNIAKLTRITIYIARKEKIISHKNVLYNDVCNNKLFYIHLSYKNKNIFSC